jgi:hypothetical protein
MERGLNGFSNADKADFSPLRLSGVFHLTKQGLSGENT